MNIESGFGITQRIIRKMNILRRIYVFEGLQGRMGDGFENVRNIEINMYKNILDNFNVEEWTKPDLKRNIVVVSDREEDILHLLKNGVLAVGLSENPAEFSMKIPYVITDLNSESFGYLDRILCRFHGVGVCIGSFEKFRICEMVNEDFDEIFSMYAGEREKEVSATYNTFLKNYMTGDYETEKEKHREYVKKAYTFYDYGLYKIVCEENGEIVGQCGFYEEEGKVWISYFVKVAYRGQGIACNACRVALKYLKNEVGIERVCASISCDNEASQNLAKKLGCYLEDTFDREMKPLRAINDNYKK